MVTIDLFIHLTTKTTRQASSQTKILCVHNLPRKIEKTQLFQIRISAMREGWGDRKQESKRAGRSEI
jgi:hypothetical protein